MYINYRALDYLFFAFVSKMCGCQRGAVIYSNAWDLKGKTRHAMKKGGGDGKGGGGGGGKQTLRLPTNPKI